MAAFVILLFALDVHAESHRDSVKNNFLYLHPFTVFKHDFQISFARDFRRHSFSLMATGGIINLNQNIDYDFEAEGMNGEMILQHSLYFKNYMNKNQIRSAGSSAIWVGVAAQYYSLHETYAARYYPDGTLWDGLLSVSGYGGGVLFGIRETLLHNRLAANIYFGSMFMKVENNYASLDYYFNLHFTQPNIIPYHGYSGSLLKGGFELGFCF